MKNSSEKNFVNFFLTATEQIENVCFFQTYRKSYTVDHKLRLPFTVSTVHQALYIGLGLLVVHRPTSNIANHAFCHLKNICFFSTPFNLPSYTTSISAVFSSKYTLHRLILSLSCMVTGARHLSLEQWAILSKIREYRYT